MTYLHTYSPTEQKRLRRQAELIQPYLYEGWEAIGQPQRILEIGCGVGAQLYFLRQRYPGAWLVGLDHSQEQLDTAASWLPGDRLELVRGRAEELPWESGSFDLVCIYWVLEHLPMPEVVLQEVDRVLRSGSWAVISEVHNPSMYFYPDCPTTMHYWKLYNQLQKQLGGNPEVGVQLPYLVTQRGWNVARYRSFAPCLNGFVSDRAARAEVVEFWTELFHSALAMLRQHNLYSKEFDPIRQELAELIENPRAVIDYSARQLLAQKP